MPLLDYWFELTTMATLVVASCFFSGSEAALFSISRSERGEMAAGSPAERRVAVLLNRPERLLTAILFWNLVVNLTYYALTTVVSVRLTRSVGGDSWAPTLFTIGALLAVILLSEVLPKSLAVLKPRWCGALVSAPLTAAVKVVDPILPSLQMVSNAVARLLFPKLSTEPYMELADLERAVEVRSGETIDSEALLIQERQVLQRLVDLADTTAAELMRPRRRCLVMQPPFSVSDVQGRIEGVGDYILVTEPDSDEIAGAVAINRLALLPNEQLSSRAEPLTIVPWCSPASDTLNRLRVEGRRVAVIVNELGETIGVLTLEQLLDAILRDSNSADPDDAHAARLVQIDDSAWEASGGMPLKRLAKQLAPWVNSDTQISTDSQALAAQMKAARSRTVGGLLQEQLARTPCSGDRVEFGGLCWQVTSEVSQVDSQEPLTIRIEPATSDQDSASSDAAVDRSAEPPAKEEGEA